MVKIFLYLCIRKPTLGICQFLKGGFTERFAHLDILENPEMEYSEQGVGFTPSVFDHSP